MNGVLFITHVTHAHAGGMEIYHHQLASSLAEALPNGVVMLPVDDPRPVSSASLPYDILSLSGINQAPRFLRDHLRYRAARWAGSRAIKTHPCDFILCGSIHLLPLAQELARAHGIPYAAICHGIEVWGDVTPVKRQALEDCDGAIAVSRFTAEKIQEKGVSPEKIFRLAPHVDAAHYRPDPVIGAGWRRKMGWQKKKVLLTVGRLAANEQYKGHDAVLQALHKITGHDDSLLYAIAGTGDDQPRLEALVRQLGLQERVQFLGFVGQRELPALYNACDVFLMPSRIGQRGSRWVGEGFGIVFLEASACGKPVIGPNEGGAVDAIEHGVTGITLAPDNVQEIADAVRSLLRDPAWAEQLGRQGRARIERDYSLPALQSQTQEWIQTLTQRSQSDSILPRTVSV